MGLKLLTLVMSFLCSNWLARLSKLHFASGFPRELRACRSSLRLPKAPQARIWYKSRSIAFLVSSNLVLQGAKRVASEEPRYGKEKVCPSTSGRITTARKLSSSDSVEATMKVDKEYPGTAVQRLENVHQRVKQLAEEKKLVGRPWEDIRRDILWAGGLKDLPDAAPGQGYTGHAFNDYNHVDLTTMNDESTFNENDGSVKQIAIGNRLGPGIQIASLPELGPGGSWSTCANNCHVDPPQDVAHVQFRSRIAFKLVWVPDDFTSFVLVDDAGKLLAYGEPSEGPLPDIRQRAMNYRLVQGSKYAKEADMIAKGVASE